MENGNRTSALTRLADGYKQPVAPGVLLPEIDIPQEKYLEVGLRGGESNLEFLTALCRKGFKDKGLGNKPNSDEYVARIKRELKTFDELGFVDYVLLNWDIIGFCHDKGIPTGPGRGSAAGSIVLWLIGVTEIDPIKYELFFERFVSKSRSRKIEVDGVVYLDGSLLADVDNDISYDQRSDVIDYINKKYKGSTARILTLNTLTSKLCIKECMKIVGDMSEVDANHVSGMIPKYFGKVLPISKAIDESKEFRSFAEKNAKIIKIAKKIEGLNKNFGVHPSGIAISRGKIADLMPLQRTSDGDICASYTMYDVAALAVKFDILGVRTLTIVDNTAKQLGIDPKKDIDPEDPFIYRQLQDLDKPYGLFQIEAGTNYQVVKTCKPRNLSELSDVVALARPGALDYMDEYVKNKYYSERYERRHPVLDEILDSSHGVILFQEQLMAIAHRVFGLTLEDAESLRRIVGKKKTKEIPKWKDTIYKQAEKLGLDKSLADFYWGVLEASSNYSFNKSHSISYATVSAWTTYLKFKHPMEYFLSLLSIAKETPDPYEEIESISIEMAKFGIKLLPPDLNKSKMEFSIEDGNIRYGLDTIKGVSDKTKKALVRFRGTTGVSTKYEMFKIAKKCGLNIGVLSALIQAGTLSSFGGNRSLLALEAQVFNILTAREKRNFEAIGKDYDYNLLQSIYDAVKEQRIADDGKPIMKQTRFATFKKKYQKYRDIYDKNSRYPKFASWYFERKLLGYSYSTTLSKSLSKDDSISSISSVSEKKNKSRVKVFGVVTDAVSGKSKAGNHYLRVSLVDESGRIDALMVDNQRSMKFTEYKEKGLAIPDKDDIIAVVGTKSDDIIFVDELHVVSEKIYMKLSDLDAK